jgi:DUF971 family protein
MPHPTAINLKTKSRLLTIRYDDGSEFDLGCEYLRVYSPSAEVKGHGPGQSVLQTGKEQVNITEIVPVGSYGVRLVFDDGHDTGIYTWEYLYNMGQMKATMWADYLQALAVAGHQRKQDERD